MEEEILNLIEIGYTQRKIAEIKGVREETISRRIAKIDMKKVEKARQEARKLKQEARQKEIEERQEKIQKARREAKKAKQEEKEAKEKEILNLIEAGYTQTRIAEIQGVTDLTISRKIAKIDMEKVEESRQKAREAIEEEILNLIKAGYTQIRIAKKQGVTRQTISKRIAEIDVKKVEEARQAKENLNLRKNIEQKLEEDTITNQDIKAYREHLGHQISITLDEIKFMVKIYIKTNQPTNAINFINSILNEETANSLDKNKLLELKKQIIKMKNIQQVRKLLRSKMPTKEIAQKIGISEEEVIQIKRQIEAKKEPEI